MFSAGFIFSGIVARSISERIQAMKFFESSGSHRYSALKEMPHTEPGVQPTVTAPSDKAKMLERAQYLSDKLTLNGHKDTIEEFITFRRDAQEMAASEGNESAALHHKLVADAMSAYRGDNLKEIHSPLMTLVGICIEHHAIKCVRYLRSTPLDLNDSAQVARAFKKLKQEEIKRDLRSIRMSPFSILTLQVRPEFVALDIIFKHVQADRIIGLK